MGRILTLHCPLSIIQNEYTPFFYQTSRAAGWWIDGNFRSHTTRIWRWRTEDGCQRPDQYWRYRNQWHGLVGSQRGIETTGCGGSGPVRYRQKCAGSADEGSFQIKYQYVQNKNHRKLPGRAEQ